MVRPLRRAIDQQVFLLVMTHTQETGDLAKLKGRMTSLARFGTAMLFSFGSDLGNEFHAQDVGRGPRVVP
jgi:hypothetical protein